MKPADLAQTVDSLPPPPADEPLCELWAEQRQRWVRGERPPLETFFSALPDPTDPAQVLDLIYGELVLRQERGETFALDDYRTRFPHLAARIEQQWLVHQALRASVTENLEETQPDGPLAVKEPERGAVPARIGKYLVVGALGRGGQAEVFRALHPALAREVAIKRSTASAAPGTADRHALLTEGRILSQLDHPHLVRVHDFDFDGDRPFLVMDYVPGVSLEQRAQSQRCPPAQAAAWVACLARAVAAAHARGIVHRDIKPANVMLDEAGQPRLVDFGLALVRDVWNPLSAATQLAGTVLTMAPEQARSEADRIGPASDIFGLGGVLFFLLTGQPLYRGTSFGEVLEQAKVGRWDEAALGRERVPRALQAICRRALAPDPAQRYPSAAALAVDLEACARPPRYLGLLVGAAAVLLLIGLWLAFGRGGHQPAAETVAAGPTQPSAAVGRVALSIRVWRRERFVDLPDAVPLRTGDELRVQAEVPPQLHAALFLRTSAGQLELLNQLLPTTTERTLTYPVKTNQTVPLVGPSGTEVLLCCARRDSPIRADELAVAWPTDGVLPALPGPSVLRLERERVAVEQSSRGFGVPKDRPDPEGQVRAILEKLRGQLAQRYDSWEGLAFSHND